MSAKGMRAMKSAAQEYAAERGGGMRHMTRLEDGETAYLLFMADEYTEPYVSREHSYRQRDEFRSIVCRESNCVACHANSAGDKRVGRPSPKGVWSVFDLRWCKRVLDKKKSEKYKKKIYSYLPLDEDDVTDVGVRKKIHMRRGKCAFSLANQWAQALDAVNENGKKRCKSCGKGKITLIGYENAEGKPVSSRLVDKLGDEKVEKKLAEGEWSERLECSRCEEPDRQTIYNSVVAVTRTGTDTSTSYAFQILPDDLPEDVDLTDEEPFDFESLKKPLSAQKQAELLGVRNPFKGESGDDAEDYEEEEDDEEPFDDDDDEDAGDDPDDDEDADEGGEDDDEPFDDEEDEDAEDSEDDDDYGTDDDDEDEEEERPRRKGRPVKEKRSKFRSKKSVKKKAVVKKRGKFRPRR